MKKIFIISAILALSTLTFSPALAKVWGTNVTFNTSNVVERMPRPMNANANEMPLSCQVLLVFLQWGFKHPDQYIAIVDFNKDRVINLIDLTMFAGNRFNNGWCSKQLGWNN